MDHGQYREHRHSEDDSDGHDSEEDPLVRKTRKANRKLRSMKLRNHEHSSQSGLGMYTFLNIFSVPELPTSNFHSRV